MEPLNESIVTKLLTNACKRALSLSFRDWKISKRIIYTRLLYVANEIAKKYGDSDVNVRQMRAAAFRLFNLRRPQARKIVEKSKLLGGS